MTCRWSHNSTLPERDAWVCTDCCAHWPFAHLSHTVNLLCAAMLRKEMQRNPRLSLVSSQPKGDAISPLRSKFPFFGQPFEYLYGPNFMLDLRLTEDESKTGKGGIDLLRMIGAGKKKLTSLCFFDAKIGSVAIKWFVCLQVIFRAF